MGIFSNKCANPNCDSTVPKTATYCRKCGSAAPDADTNCGRCGVTVSTSSKFCWKCGADLFDQKKIPLFDGRWVRSGDDYAIRVDEGDLKGWLSKGINIEHGTEALLFQQGKYRGTLKEGSYDMGGFVKKFATLNTSTPTSIVLVDAGDIELHLEALNLHSREQMPVDAAFKALVRLRDGEQFFVNAFKGRNRLTVGYLGGSIMDELRAALQSFVVGKSVEELYNNPDIRKEVEREMQLQLEPILERIGLEMVQLRFVDFFCEKYDPIREKEADTYLDTRQADIDIDRLKLTQRLRKSMTEEQMDKIKTDSELENFIRQTEHELGLKDVIRDDEMQRLKIEFAHNRNKELLMQVIEIEGIKKDEARSQAIEDLQAKLQMKGIEIETFKLEQDAKREDGIKTSKATDEIERTKIDRDMYEADQAVKLREKNQNLEIDRQQAQQQLEAQRLQEYSKASAQALLAILDGPAADRIAQLEQLRVKQNLTPDQLIAMTAAESPQVAQVLAEKYKAQAAVSDERFKQLEDFMAQQQTSHVQAADRLERVMNVALGQMGATATTRAQAPQPGSQTVVTPGGAGSPVVVNPAGQQNQEISCPKCKEKIPADSRFCPNCRNKM